jgi:multicomponent Na+:H+ antiporter subunit D
MFLAGIALFTPLGLAGAAVYVVGHGLVKAALFLCIGIVLHRLGSVNETWLHGRGRHLRATGVVFTLAALGLTDLPPFATFLGKGYIDDSAWAHGLPWVMGVFIACSILAGGAVLRAGCSTASVTRPRKTPRWPRWPPKRPARPTRTSSGPRSP